MHVTKPQEFDGKTLYIVPKYDRQRSNRASKSKFEMRIVESLDQLNTCDTYVYEVTLRKRKVIQTEEKVETTKIVRTLQ